VLPAKTNNLIPKSQNLSLCKYLAAAGYNQKDATFLNLFISVRCSACFRRFSRPSSGAQNCTYSVRYTYFSDQYCYLLLAPTHVLFFSSWKTSTPSVLNGCSGMAGGMFSVKHLHFEAWKMILMMHEYLTCYHITCLVSSSCYLSLQ